jgi:cyanophycin synthetase
VPIAFQGTARHNVENALAAVLAALAAGLPGEAAARGLRTFRPSVDDNPGRMNTFRLPSGALAIIDFAHNPDGVRRIAETVRTWPRGRRTLLIGQAGDRRDEEIVDMARTSLLLGPDRIVLKDVTDRLYGRSLGEVPRLMWSALRQAGVPPERIHVAPDETTGVRQALHGVGRDDVVVLLIHETLNAAVSLLREQGAVEVG